MRTQPSRRASSLRVLSWLSAPVALGAALAACSSSLHLDPPGSSTGTGGGGGGATTTTGTSTTDAATGTGGSAPSACDSNHQCTYPADICDTVAHQCVECLVSADCSPKPGTVCSLGACVCPKSAETFCPASGPTVVTGWQPDRCVDVATAQDDCGTCGHGCFGGCAAKKCVDAWEPTSAFQAPEARTRHVAVWDSTDKLMIVWGGKAKGGATNTGGIYDPATGKWTSTSLANAPSERLDATAVWDDVDKVMIVWGGHSTQGATPLGTGGLYYPAKNIWKPITTQGAPSARYGHTAVWTGTRMIVWGGTDGVTQDADGVSYDPATNTWTGAVSPFLTARTDHSAIWTGSTMVIWGGFGTDGVASNIYLNDGAVYDLSSWTPLAVPGPTKRARHTAVWTSMSMMLFGGADSPSSFLSDGAKYQAAGWFPLNNPAPEEREGHSAVWIKTSITSAMLIWGGQNANGALASGYTIDETSLNWSGPLPTGPTARAHHTGVVNGSQMIIWGGDDGGVVTGSGAVFDASTL